MDCWTPLQARVERLERGADGRLSGVVYVDRRSGVRYFQAADVMVVACNGVGTPRLLLMSGDLANGSDQVGRNLMHHILVAAELWVEEPPPLAGAGVVVCLMG